MSCIYVWTDGLVEPYNPNGVGAYAFWMKDDIGRNWWSEKGVVGEGKGITSVAMEYEAIIQAMHKIINNHLNDKVRFVFYSDSQTMIHQLRGEWKANGGAYLDKYLTAKELLSHFPDITFEWIPRTQNEVADKMTHEAYEAWCKDHNRIVKYHRRKGQGIRYSKVKSRFYGKVTKCL